MKQVQLLAFIVLFSSKLYSQWATTLTTNPYTGGNNVTIKNNDPDFVLEHTSNDIGEASYIFSDAGGDESYFGWDFSSNEYFWGTSNVDPNVASMTLNRFGDMELRGANPQIYFRDTDNNLDGFLSMSTSGDLTLESSVDDVLIDAENRLFLNTDDITRMTIDKSGNVGIGDSSPDAKLHINDGRIRIETITNSCPFVGGTYDETGLDIYDGTTSIGGLSYSDPCIYIFGEPTNSVSVTNANGGAVILNAGSSSVLTARENNRVGINDLSPSYTLDVNGDGNFTGELMAASDARLKENIVPIQDATDIIQELNPVSFTFRHADFPHMHLSEGQRWGLLAQEVETILPELVNTGGETSSRDGETFDSKSVNYIDMIPIIIKAQQEMMNELAQKDKEITDLKKQIHQLLNND